MNRKKLRIANNKKMAKKGLKDNRFNSMYFPNANQMTMDGMKDPVHYFGVTDGIITDEGVAFPGEDFSVNGQDTVEFRLKNNNMRKYLKMGNRIKAQNSLKVIPDMKTQATIPEGATSERIKALVDAINGSVTQGDTESLGFWLTDLVEQAQKSGLPIESLTQYLHPDIAYTIPDIQSSLASGVDPQTAVASSISAPRQDSGVLPINQDYGQFPQMGPGQTGLKVAADAVNNPAVKLQPYLQTLQQAHAAQDPNYGNVVEELLQEGANLGLTPSDLLQYLPQGVNLTDNFGAPQATAPQAGAPQVTKTQTVTPTQNVTQTSPQGNLPTGQIDPITAELDAGTPITGAPAQITQPGVLRNNPFGARVTYNPQSGLYEKSGFGYSDYVAQNQPTLSTGDVTKELGLEKAQTKGKGFNEVVTGIKQRGQDLIDKMRDERSDKEKNRYERMYEKANDLEKRGLETAAHRLRERAGTIKARNEDLKEIESLQRDKISAQQDLKQSKQQYPLSKRKIKLLDKAAKLRDKTFEKERLFDPSMDYEESKANYERAIRKAKRNKKVDKKEFKTFKKQQKLDVGQYGSDYYQEGELMDKVYEQMADREKRLNGGQGRRYLRGGGRDTLQFGKRKSFQADYQINQPIDLRYNDPEAVFQIPDLTKSAAVTNVGDRYKDIDPVYGDPTFSLNYANKRIDLGLPSNVASYKDVNTDDISSNTGPGSDSFNQGQGQTPLKSKWWRRFHNAAQIAGMAAPTLYNMRMSMMPARKVSPEYNKELRTQLAQMQRRKPTIDYRRIDAQNTAFDRALRNQIGNTAGINAARLSGYNKKLQNLGSMELEKDKRAQQIALENAQFAAQVGADERAAEQMARRETEQAETTRQGFEKAFAEDLNTLFGGMGQLAGTDRQNELEWNMMAHIYQNYGPGAYEAVMSGQVPPAAFFKQGSGVTSIS